jgi:hypothetical protein
MRVEVIFVEKRARKHFQIVKNTCYVLNNIPLQNISHFAEACFGLYALVVWLYTFISGNLRQLLLCVLFLKLSVKRIRTPKASSDQAISSVTSLRRGRTVKQRLSGRRVWLQFRKKVTYEML